jgi:hypothetical protein
MAALTCPRFGAAGLLGLLEACSSIAGLRFGGVLPLRNEPIRPALTSTSRDLTVGAVLDRSNPFTTTYPAPDILSSISASILLTTSPSEIKILHLVKR